MSITTGVLVAYSGTTKQVIGVEELQHPRPKTDTILQDLTPFSRREELDPMRCVAFAMHVVPYPVCEISERSSPVTGAKAWRTSASRPLGTGFFGCTGRGGGFLPSAQKSYT